MNEVPLETAGLRNELRTNLVNYLGKGIIIQREHGMKSVSMDAADCLDVF